MSARNLLAILVMISVGWRSVQAAEPATAAEMQKLVEQLGGARAEDITRAKKRLAEIGMPALPALRQTAFQNKAGPRHDAAAAVIKQITDQARKALVVRLGKRTRNAIISQVADEAVARTFPAFLAFAVRYPLYPTAVRPPAPLKTQNLFIVDRDGQMEHLVDFQGLNDFFRENVGKEGLKKETVKRVAHAWLALSQEFSQDGFLTFTIAADAIKVGTAAGGLRGTGRAMVKPEKGNKGFIEVTVIFGLTGDLAGIKQNKHIFTGPRPKGN